MPDHGIKITHVAPSGPARKAGIRPGDVLESINHHPVRDILDVRFYSAETSPHCRFSGASGPVETDLPEEEDWGLEFEPMQFRSCGNRCIFCFVDQNPPGLRKSLYFKDEDYRLSFLHGNYITLTHVSKKDLERIAEQKLSPLYVSVHAADGAVRARLLGRRGPDDLLGKLSFLKEHGIEVHGQIVVCPGINDGAVLDETIRTLSPFYPSMRSLAVVPVGLTRYREGLTPLRGLDKTAAGELIERVRRFQKGFRKSLKTRFVWAADECFLQAQRSVPPAREYEDFWQTENGVGLVRHFIDELKQARSRFPRRMPPRKLAVITGTLAAPVLRRHLLPACRRIRGLELRIVPVKNRFFGETVTVSGLLTAGDIGREGAALPGEWELLIPDHCLNHDGLFLDGGTLQGLERLAGRPVHAVDRPWRIWEIE